MRWPAFSPLSGVGLYLFNENLAASTAVESCPTPATCTALTPAEKAFLARYADEQPGG